MRLTIEPPEATRESYSGTRRHNASRAESCILTITVQRQELPRWCWAAIAVSLGEYYRTRSRCQHQIATEMLGFDCSAFMHDPELRKRCDVNAMLDDALRLVDCYSHWSPGRPTIERVRTEIDAGRPLCIQLDWFRGESHYVMVTGYYAGTDEIVVEDPLHGPSIQHFDEFPRGYRAAGGRWHGTFWTLPPISDHQA